MDTALAQVRALAGRDSSSNSSIISAVEVLVDTAGVHNHPDRQQYKTALKVIREKETAGYPLNSLAIKLLGNEVEKKVYSSAETWLKAQRKIREKPDETVRSGTSSGSDLATILQLLQQPQTYGAYRRGRGFRGRGSGSRPGTTRLCYLCKSPDHLVQSCPKLGEAGGEKP